MTVNKKIMILLFGLSIIVLGSSMVNAASIDLLHSKKTVSYGECLGVDIDGLYYTVLFNDGLVTKIELDGVEEPTSEINISSGVVEDFLNNYGSFGPMEKIGFMVNKLGFPVKWFLDFDGFLN